MAIKIVWPEMAEKDLFTYLATGTTETNQISIVINLAGYLTQVLNIYMNSTHLEERQLFQMSDI